MKLSTTQQEDISNLRYIFKVASYLQTNITYEKGISSLKECLNNNDIPAIINIIQAIKIILTFQDVSKVTEILDLEQVASEELEQQFKDVVLTQYSKLLAVRVVRDLFFTGSYAFMVLTFTQLGQIFKKIALFKLKIYDSNKGKELFSQSKDPVFQRIVPSYRSTFESWDLQKIAYSIHKLVIEIVSLSTKVSQCIPCHQKFIQNNPTLAQYLQNPFSQIAIELKMHLNSLPSDFFYFRQDNIESFAIAYQASLNDERIGAFYSHLFDYILRYVGEYFNGNVKDYDMIEGLLFCKKTRSISIIISICQKLSAKDRHFWNYLLSFYTKRKTSIQLDISNKNYMLSIIILNSHNPEAVHHFASNLLQKLDEIHNQLLQRCCNDYSSHLLALNYVAMRYNVPRQNMLLKSPLKKRAKEAQNNAQYFSSLLNLLIIINELSFILFKQMNKSHYKNICLYLESILSGIPAFDPILTKLVFIIRIRQKLRDSIRNNISQYRQAEKILECSNETQTYFGGLQLLRYKKVEKIKTIIKNYNNTDLVNLYQDNLLEEEVIIEPSQVHTREIEEITSHETISLKKNNFKLHLSNSSETPMLFETPNKSETQMICSQRSANSRLSFRQSLSIDIKPRDIGLFRSLSKNKRRRGQLQLGLSGIQMTFSGRQSKMTSPKLKKMDPVWPFQFKQGYEQVQIPTFSVKKRKINVQKFRGEEINQQASLQSRVSKSAKSKDEDIVQLEESSQSISNLNIVEPKKTSEQKTLVEELYSHQSTKQKQKEQILFYFPAAVKKQLLKKKFCVHKSKFLEIGVIIRPHHHFLQRVTISVFITAISPLQRVSININSPSWIECKAKVNRFIDSIQRQGQRTSSFDMELKISHQEQQFNYGSFPTVVVTYYQGNKQQRVEKPVPFLITNFLSQMKIDTSKSPQNYYSNKSVISLTLVNEKVALKLKDLQSYFNLLYRSKDNIADFATHIKIDADSLEELGFSSLIFGPTGEQLLLAFVETQNNYYNWKHKEKFDIYLYIMADQHCWDYEIMHAIKICLLSIFAA